MTTFPALRHALAEATGEPLTLTLSDRVAYTFTRSFSIAAGLHMQRLNAVYRQIEDSHLPADATEADMLAALDPEEAKWIKGERDEHALYIDLIGASNFAAMQAAGLPWAEMEHVGQTLLAWHVTGAAAALAMWQRGEAVGSDRRPPAGGSSTPPTTSPKSSTRKNSTSTSPPRSSGRKSSTRGSASKPTSRASTRSTSRTRKP